MKSALLQAGDKDICLADRFFHLSNKLIHSAFQAEHLTLQGSYCLRIQIVLEIKHLIMKNSEHRLDFAFSPFHGGNQLLVLTPGGFQFAFAILTQGGIGILPQLGLPLPEERLGDRFYRIYTLMHLIGLGLAALVFAVEFLVLGLKIATLDLHHFGELLQGRLELFLGFCLCIPRLFDPIHHDVALVHAEFFHGVVIGAGAACQHKGWDKDT